MSRFIILIVLILAAHNATPLEILAIISLPLRSHYMAFDRLFRELAKRGHSVTVVNNYPDKTPIDNLQFIKLSVNSSESNKFRGLDEYEQYTFLYWDNFVRHIKSSPKIVEDDCEVLFESKDLQKLLDEKQFDVIFVEQFVSDCALALAGVKSMAPIIGITSHVLLPWSYPRLGIPFDVNTNLFYFSNAGNKPGAIRIYESLVMQRLWNHFALWLIHSRIYKVFDKHLPGYGLDVQQVAYNRMKMTFTYQHFSYMGARLLSPQLLEIGGIHIGTPKRLPEEIDKFLNDSTNGAIYVSFGSNLRSSTMSQGMLQNFLNAFKLIKPVRVIWKLEIDALPPGNENVLIGSWFPQLDILCHPKLLGFISHGGMLSITESASCGVPMIAIPFFGDQFTNAVAIDAHCLGLYLGFNHVTSETLANSIRKILSNRFQEQAKKISSAFHDRPISAMDSAIYWTEYVARHGEAFEGEYEPWYQVWLIDAGYSFIIFIGVFNYLYSHYVD